MPVVTVRDRTRLLGLASISLGVAFLAIYASGSTHPTYRLVIGVVAIGLGLVNLNLSRR